MVVLIDGSFGCSFQMVILAFEAYELQGFTKEGTNRTFENSFLFADFLILLQKENILNKNL